MAATEHGAWWGRWNFDMSVQERTAAMEGRFVELFHDEPAATVTPEDLDKLAVAMTAPPDDPPTREEKDDAEENPGVPAAYTYFGQFIDHDLTFDPTSSLRERVGRSQLAALVNFRTPRFDLDSLYGRGSDDQPYLYQGDDPRLLLLGRPLSGNSHDAAAVDVPRGPNGRALIGDPRNDENRIVTQLHATMLRFHNAVAATCGKDASFAEIRQQVRWHYQWVVVHDFLSTVVAPEVIAAVFPPDGGQADLRIPVIADGLSLMPVEFSVAAYRFGHSMIRPIYRINETIERRQIFSTATDPAGDLGGMRPLPEDWAVDWQFFLDVEAGPAPGLAGDVPGDDQLTRKPQPSYRIDTSLVNPLGKLPPRIAGENVPELARRNLLRGAAFRLPSGQAVAKAMHLDPLTEEQLRIGKAIDEDDAILGTVAEIAPSAANGECPLWTYVLAEGLAGVSDAKGNVNGSATTRLGPVGGHIVAETMRALLRGDPTSILHHPEFAPIPAFTRGGTFGLAEMIAVGTGVIPAGG